ncbi:MAG: DUF2927 domain-containing protein [Gammaproteobacteria bacterium]|nr:DUF2927 domain-containing protein [Gammaproteobacteria bacterium]
MNFQCSLSPRRLLAGLLGVKFLLLCTATLPVTAGTELTKEEQRQILDEAVHILGGNANVITRWNSAVRFAQIGGDEREDRAAVRIVQDATASAGLDLEVFVTELNGGLYLEQVRQSPKLDLSVCPPEEVQCANFIVVHTDAEIMRALAAEIPLRPLYHDALQRSRSIPCFFAPHKITASEIFQVLIYVREDLSPELTDTCLQEEIWQSFGLFGDVTGSRYFSFDNRVAPKSLTSYDQALLEALYHPSLGPGAPVFRVLRQFMDALEFDLYENQ